jgi:DNA polymerase-3 subunit gamma/tau
MSGNDKDTEETTGAAAKPYVVLARKYRPRSFEDLIGQEAMVRTLKNAFALKRIAQAYMLTGVRGVGKTTTARILARALNYSRPGEEIGPTIDIAIPGEHCQAILESRHMDVVEMDAASNTGIDDIREIIESVKYMPAYARYKVFIIDEVHMLSKAAFNGLLKTLEEPPPHVKFVFATTEIRKVPVTVLSRCQRFDLRRVDIALLKAHFARIAELEGQRIEDEALTLIARLAEGSVRDGLSLLDQAFALGAGHVTGEYVKSMAGLADGVRIFELLETILKGEVAAALHTLNALYDAGADPLQLLTDLAGAVHTVTLIKAAGTASAALAQAEKERAAALAAKLPVAALTRAWQMLLKGLEEAGRAPRAIAAAEMIVIRLCYVADLPPPGDLVKMLAPGQQRTADERPQTAPRSAASAETSTARVLETPSMYTAEDDERPFELDDMPEFDPDAYELAAYKAGPAAPPEPLAPPPPVLIESFAGAVALAASKRDIRMKIALEDQVRLVRFKPPHIELHLLDDAPRTLAQDFARRLQEWTGQRWIVSVSDSPGERPLGELRREEEARLKEEARRHPLVQAMLKQFPEAEILSVKRVERPEKSGKASQGGE